MQWSTQGIWRPATVKELMYVDHGNSTVERALWEQQLRSHDLKEKNKTADRDNTLNRHTSKKKETLLFMDPKRVKCCNRSKHGTLMVAADDRQRIALWRWPAVQGSKCRLFAGHGNQVRPVVKHCLIFLC